jgi:hypothetical protein
MMKIRFVLLLVVAIPALLTAQKVKLERLDYEAPANMKADLDPGSRPQTLYPPRKKFNSASYSTFWIYPDGNFNTLDFEPNSTTLTNSYVNFDNGSQRLYCFLTEKYINTDPPEDAVYDKINIWNTTILPQDNTSSSELNLYINNDPRPEYKMVVAASYKKRSTADRLYLFYNNIGLAKNRYDLFEPNPSHILPQYYSNSGGVYDLSRPYIAELTDFDAYNNGIFFDLANLEKSKPPAPIERERVFSVLKTMPSRNVEGFPYGQYANLVGILVGKDPNPISINEVNIAKSLKIGQVKQESLESGVVALGDYYLLGIDTLLRPIAETHDPNQLRLIKICRDANNLIIDYELDICNDYPVTEDRIDLSFTGINRYVIENVTIKSPGSRTVGRSSDLTSAPFAFDPIMSLNFADHVEPHCETVVFTVTIPFDGDLDRAEQTLAKHEGFIQYCVKFNNTRDAIDECDFKYSFDTLDNNYKIELCKTEPTSTGFTWRWWYWIFIVIIVVPIIWKFFAKKKHDDD